MDPDVHEVASFFVFIFIIVPDVCGDVMLRYDDVILRFFCPGMCRGRETARWARGSLSHRWFEGLKISSIVLLLGESAERSLDHYVVTRTHLEHWVTMEQHLTLSGNLLGLS